MAPSTGERARKTKKGLALAALLAAPLLLLAVFVIPATPAATGPTLYVANGNPSCSNSGPGTAAQPFCTIGAAASRTVAGSVVQVAAGTYNERVSPPTSGTAASPIVYTAATDASVTVGSGQADGFLVSGKSWITVNGFDVTGTTGYGIDVTSASSHVTISNNHIQHSGQPVSGQTKYGIRINGSTDVTISGNTVDHNTDAGIAVVGSSSGAQVLNNNSFANARGYTRAAAGIRVYQSRDNTVAGNLAHDNEDSGIESYPGSTGAMIWPRMPSRSSWIVASPRIVVIALLPSNARSGRQCAPPTTGPRARGPHRPGRACQCLATSADRPREHGNEEPADRSAGSVVHGARVRGRDPRSG